jgi:hypothetical protein
MQYKIIYKFDNTNEQFYYNVNANSAEQAKTIAEQDLKMVFDDSVARIVAVVIDSGVHNE